MALFYTAEWVILQIRKGTDIARESLNESVVVCFLCDAVARYSRQRHTEDCAELSDSARSVRGTDAGWDG